MNTIGNAEDPFPRLRAEEQALAILQAMAREVSGAVNDRVLAAYLDQIALGGLGDEVRAAILRLENLGLVKTRAVDHYLIATLTELGERVANGRAAAEGVSRPRRGERD